MNFVLVPDAVTANYVREGLAKESISNVKVGNFQSLLEILQELWLLPENEDTFSRELEATALSISDAFWSNSIQVDEPNVARLLENTASAVFRLSNFKQLPQIIDSPSNRSERYLNDILRLIQKSGVQPVEHELIASWINVNLEDSLSEMILYFDESLVELEPWQKEVVNRLLATQKVDQSVSEKINAIFNSLKCVGADQYVALGQKLFTDLPPQDVFEGLTGILCRDYIFEAQLVANRIKTLVEAGESLDQIAIIYPSQSDMPLWLKQSMDALGIPVSNLPHDEVARDWQKQLLRDLIRLQIDNPPPMAYHSVLSNPLMPWSSSSALNRILKQDEKAKEIADENTEGLYDLIHKKVLDVASLNQWLVDVGRSLKKIPMFNLTEQHWQFLMNQISIWIALFKGQSFEVISQNLLSQLRSSILKVSSEKEFYLNSVLAVSSNERLPKTINHLFIVGFNEGHYRYHVLQPVENTLFDLNLCNQLGFGDALQRLHKSQKNILKSNLSKVKESLTITASKQTLDGTVIELSESALDLALCFQEPKDVAPSALFVKPEALPTGFITWKNILPDSTVLSELQDLNFGINLLLLHRDRDGNQRKESPSSLEKMMTSPLDWLLSRQGLDDQSWEVQTLDIQTQGLIAHKVFELYKVYQPSEIDDNLFDQLFNQALLSEAEFVLQPHWRLEKTHLRQEVKKALDAFILWLQQEKWTIVDVEKELQGALWNIPLKGYADAVLAKADEVMILDYKKSKSDKRFSRLEAGFDLQTYIYRELYKQETGKEKLHSGYFTLNDQILVLDQGATNSNSSINIKVPEMTEITDQSKSAREMIDQRLNELGKGKVMLNRSSDQDIWKKRGIDVYSLTDNPIVQRFVIEEDGE